MASFSHVHYQTNYQNEKGRNADTLLSSILNPLPQKTNFRLFQTIIVCRRQFQNWQKWQKVTPMGRKHWEKEKLLVTSNFSFSHSVFKRFVSQGCQKVSLCGNGLIKKLDMILIQTNDRLVSKAWATNCAIGWLVVLGFNATLKAKFISWRSVTHVSWLCHTSTNTTFLSKATNYFSHMFLQRWEAKICQKESSPQPGIKLTTTLTTEPPRWGQICNQTSAQGTESGYSEQFSLFAVALTSHIFKS